MELTPEIIDKLCSYVKIGASIDAAALAEGIYLKTLTAWLQLGSESEPEDIHAILIHRIDQARAQAEIIHINRIVQSGTAKESQWMLERMFPEKWAPKRGDEPKRKATASILDAAFTETTPKKRIGHKK